MWRTSYSSCSPTRTSTTIGITNKASDFHSNRWIKLPSQLSLTGGIFPHHPATLSLLAAESMTNLYHLPWHPGNRLTEFQLNQPWPAIVKIVIHGSAPPPATPRLSTISVSVIIRRLKITSTTPVTESWKKQEKSNHESACFWPFSCWWWWLE